MPGERTEQEKQRALDAQMARARVRRGAMLERLQERLSQGDPSGEDQGIQPRLNAKQLRVLREYQSGELRKEANRLTMISGHGRLKREDHTFVDNESKNKDPSYSFAFNIMMQEEFLYKIQFTEWRCKDLLPADGESSDPYMVFSIAP